VSSAKLIAGEQRAPGFGGTAVRAYIQDPGLIDPKNLKAPAIIFRTLVEPTAINHPQSAAVWSVEELPIIIDRIIKPGE